MSNDERSDEWLALCGSCDAGLPMNCTCPAGDYRPIMAELRAERDRARDVAVKLEQQLTRAETLFQNVRATWPHPDRCPNRQWHDVYTYCWTCWFQERAALNPEESA